MQKLPAAGCNAMHLRVSPKNRGAQKFYLKLGFAELKQPPVPRHTPFMVTPFR